MQVSMKCSVSVHCLIYIYEAADSVRVTSAMLAQSTGCNPVVIRSLLSALKKAGIIQVQRGTGGAVLTRPPKEITLYQIYSALEPNGIDGLIGIHACSGRECPIARNIGKVLRRSYGEIEDSIRRTMEEITLQSMIDDFHAQLQQE